MGTSAFRFSALYALLTNPATPWQQDQNYLPALSDVILMVEGTSFMGLGGPNLVKGATGQTIVTIEGVAPLCAPDSTTSRSWNRC